MAAVTVVVDSNFDDAALQGLNNNENITITNGATLTLNSDNRYGQTAAVWREGYVNEGAFNINGETVWWVPFDASSGTVPALGTVGIDDVQIGGNNVGEFLGIWTGLRSAPLAAGTPLPTTGYVKLRSKSGIIADDNVLTFTNNSATVTVNSPTGGQRGWLEIVGQRSPTITKIKLSAFGTSTIQGDWFDIGISDGSIGQSFEFYIAGYSAGVEVETAAGSNEYEWYPAIPLPYITNGTLSTTAGSNIVTGTGTNFSTSRLKLGGPLVANGTLVGFVSSVDSSTQVTLTTNALRVVTNEPNIRTHNFLDTRYYGNNTANRYCFVDETGMIHFGGDLIGVAPPNGAKIRSPNLFFAVSSNSVDLLTGDGLPESHFVVRGESSSCFTDKACGQILHSNIFERLTVKNSALMNGITPKGTNNSNILRSINILYENISANVMFTGNSSYASPWGIQDSSDIILRKCKTIFQLNNWFRSTFLTNSRNILIEDCFFANIHDNQVSLAFQGCSNTTVTNTICMAGRNGNVVSADGCDGLAFNNLIILPRLGLNTVGLAGGWCRLYNSNDVLINGIDGYVEPVTGQIKIENVKDFRIRNIGTYDAPKNAGADFLISGYGSEGARIAIANVYLTDSGGFNRGLDSRESLYMSSTITNASGLNIWTASGKFKTPGYCRRVLSHDTPDYNAIGSHFGEKIDSVSSPSLITLILAAGGIKVINDERSNRAFVNDTGTILRDGYGVLLPNVGDQTTWTWTYDIKGVTSFANTAPLINGTNVANLEITYDLNKGSGGFSGTFKALTAANLSAETGILPNKLRIRVRAKCVVANATNKLNYIEIYGNTSTAAVYNNNYCLNEAPYTISGVVTGSIAGIFTNASGELLDMNDNAPNVSLFCPWYQEESAYLRIKKAGYFSYQIINFTLMELGNEIPIFQTENSLPTTIPTATGISIVNHGASPITWQNKQWSISVIVTDGSSAATIAHYINYWGAQDAYNFDNTLHNLAYHDLIIPVGSNFETQRGKILGSTGATLKGVRVVDSSGNEVPGFARMQADDGSYYSPAAAYTLTVSNIVSGSRLLLRRTDTQAVISNVTVTSGTFTYSYTHTSDIPVEIVVRKATTSPYYQEWSTTTILSNSNNTQTANQISDE